MDIINFIDLLFGSPLLVNAVNS